MPKFAIITNGSVESVLIYPTEPIIPGRTVVALTTEAVSPGDSYDGVRFTPRVPSAAEQELSDAGGRLAQALPLLRQWAGDAQDLASLTAMTAAQRLARQAVLEDRVAKMARGLAYLIRQLGVND